jgi:hypothetical protein
VSVQAAQRFGRPVVDLENPKDYQYFKLDDVNFPMLTNTDYKVSCLVFRGTENYYVEVSIQNQTSTPITIRSNFLEFTKPGYTIYRVDSNIVATRLASEAGVHFIPTPPPQMPTSSTTTTTINANATTFGNMTQVNGTAYSTTSDNSGQAGANFGNALGNAIAARRFYRAQRDAISLAQYLASYGWNDTDLVLQPGKEQKIMMTFEQAKAKKAHFEVVIHVGSENFSFKYKE